jgi:anti-anti-sigma regulatory factor
MECVVTDYGRWRPPTQAESDRGNGLMVARHLVDQMRVRHPGTESTATPDSASTVVTLLHRLTRPAIPAPGGSPGPAAKASEPDFGVLTEHGSDGDAARTSVLGPIDIITADQVLRRLLAACRGGTLPLTVDLTGVTQLASAGVSALYELTRQLRLHQHSLALIARRGSPVQAVLDLVHLPYAAITC